MKEIKWKCDFCGKEDKIQLFSGWDEPRSPLKSIGMNGEACEECAQEMIKLWKEKHPPRP